MTGSVYLNLFVTSTLPFYCRGEWRGGGIPKGRRRGEPALPPLPVSQEALSRTRPFSSPAVRTRASLASWPSTSQLAPSAAQCFCVTHMCDLKKKKKRHTKCTGASGRNLTPRRWIPYALWRDTGGGAQCLSCINGWFGLERDKEKM